MSKQQTSPDAVGGSSQGKRGVDQQRALDLRDERGRCIEVAVRHGDLRGRRQQLQSFIGLGSLGQRSPEAGLCGIEVAASPAKQRQAGLP